MSIPANTSEIEVLNPLEDPQWDLRLGKLRGATFFHSAPWARVLHSTYGYRPLYFAHRAGNDFASVLPCMEVESWLTGRRGVSLPFTDECGPLAPDVSSCRQLFEAAQNHGKNRRWKYFECRDEGEWTQGAAISTSFFNHQLALGAGAETLFSALDSSVRRAIRKAEHSDLTVNFSQSLEDTRHFYRLLCLTRQRHGMPPQPFAFFANIQRHVLAPGHGWIVLARHRGVPVAGAVFLHFQRSVIYKFGASDQAFQHLRANNLVMWKAIEKFASEGFERLDFGRTSLHNNGLRRFKLSWNTAEHKIGYVRYEPQTQKYVTARDESVGTYNRVLQALPLFTSRLIGSMLYKHLA